jgi:predicted transposase/invertase (TIGR01784 family)
VTTLKYRLTDDDVFRILFNNYPALLIYLIASLLGITGDSITTFEILNKEIEPGILGDKFCRLDILMNINGVMVDLEVQKKNEGNYRERSLFYAKNEFRVKVGENYIYGTPAIGIGILDFKLFNHNDYQSCYQMYDVKHQLSFWEGNDKIKLLFFELPKLPLRLSIENHLELWLALFNAKTEEDLIKIYNMGDPIMTEAINAYYETVNSTEFDATQRQRERNRLEEGAALCRAKMEGEMEGRLKERIELALALTDKGQMDRASILEVTKITEEQLEKALMDRDHKS